MSSSLQDTAFNKVFLPSMSTIAQLRRYCMIIDDYDVRNVKNICFRNKKNYFKRFLELNGYDVSDNTTDFVKIYTELRDMSNNLEFDQKKNPEYISPKQVDPRNITSITMTRDLLEMAKNNGSDMMKYFLKNNGFDIPNAQKLKLLTEFTKKPIIDTATIITPRTFDIPKS